MNKFIKLIPNNTFYIYILLCYQFGVKAKISQHQKQKKIETYNINMKQVAMTFVVLYLYMKIHILFIPAFFSRVFVAIVATDNKLCKLWLENQKANNNISEISSNINEQKKSEITQNI